MARRDEPPPLKRETFSRRGDHFSQVDDLSQSGGRRSVIMRSPGRHVLSLRSHQATSQRLKHGLIVQRRRAMKPAFNGAGLKLRG